MKKNTKTICITSVFLALTFISTRFIQIPIPLGYINIGNVFILLSCLFLPMPYCIAVGGFGSALADLTSFPVYTVPTLLIKGLMPVIFLLIYKPGKSKKGFVIPAIVLSLLIPVGGYFLTGAIIYQSFVVSLAQIPALLLEYAVNLVLFFLLYNPLYKLRSKLYS